MALNNLKSVFPGSRRIAGSGRELGASARSPAASRGRATPHFRAHVGRMRIPPPPIGASAERTSHRLSQVAGGGGAGTTLGPLEGKARRSEESRGKVHITVQRRGRPQCPGGAGCEQWGQSLESPDRDLTARRGPCESPGSALRAGPHDCAQHVRRGRGRVVPRRTLFSSNFSQVNNEVYLLLAHAVSVYVVLLFQKTY